jgi:hypothetical protein
MAKKVLVISYHRDSFHFLSAHIDALEAAGCEVFKSIDPADLIKAVVPQSEYEMIVVFGDAQFLVEEINKLTGEIKPIIYVDVYGIVKDLKNAKLASGYYKYDEFLELLNEILGVEL